MKSLKILLVLLVLCFTFSGVATLSTSNSDKEDVKSIDKSEVIKIAELRRDKLKKPSNM